MTYENVYYLDLQGLPWKVPVTKEIIKGIFDTYQFNDFSADNLYSMIDIYKKITNQVHFKDTLHDLRCINDKLQETGTYTSSNNFGGMYFTKKLCMYFILKTIVVRGWKSVIDFIRTKNVDFIEF